MRSWLSHSPARQLASSPAHRFARSPVSGSIRQLTGSPGRRFRARSLRRASLGVVPSRTRPPASAVLLGLIATLSPAVAVAQQQPRGDLPVSLERIREGVEKPAEHALTLPPLVPLTRFRTGVEERTYMLPFKEQLDKDLEPTPIQAQSRDWTSRCCGLDLGVLFKSIDQGMQRRK